MLPQIPFEDQRAKFAQKYTASLTNANDLGAGQVLEAGALTFVEQNSLPDSIEGNSEKALDTLCVVLSFFGNYFDLMTDMYIITHE